MSHTQPPGIPSPPRFIVQVEIDHEGAVSQRLAFIGKERILFGRGTGSDVSFPTSERTVSALHAELVQTTGGYVLRDAASKNGLFLRQGNALVAQREIPVEVAAPSLEISLGSPGPTCRLWIGRVYSFADYLVTGQLGEGGMARVFAAQDASGLNRLVVLKIIAARFLLTVDAGEAETMLEEEARIASQICHANVVKIFRVGNHEGTPFIEMEYLQGVNLSSISQQLLHRQVHCPFDLAAALVYQACLGLHAAHEARDASGRPLEIVHRDFSPQNIMCSPEGDVKLIDFGVARAQGRQPWSTGSLFVGKAAYAAPEQISRPQAVDRRSDLFAAGVILHELIAGVSLFDRGSDYWTMNAVICDPVPPLAGVPAEVNQLLARVLAKDPADRPRTAEQLAEELEQIVHRAGGQYLKRKNIAQSLRRLGVCLDAPSPRSLQGCPTVFPRPHRTPVATPERRPMARKANQRVLTPTAQVKDPWGAIPEKLAIGGYDLDLGQRLQEYTLQQEDSYSHVILKAQAHDSTNDGGASAVEVRVHLIGAPSLGGPLETRQRAHLEGFVERWRTSDEGPFIDLLADGEAWPGGPLAIVVRHLDPLWADALTRITSQRIDPVALCFSLVRCLAVATKRFPGFTHSALGPLQVMLSPQRNGDSSLLPRLVLGPWLDWLLANEPHPIPALERLSLDRALYMAPECLRGAAPTPASDIFSAAMMAYELMGGNLTAATWTLRQGGRLPPLPPSSPSPPALRAALAASLHPDPERRPVASELLRLCELSVAEPGAGTLELPAPLPGEVLSSIDAEGRKVHLHTLRMQRHLHRGPFLLPFMRVPQLLPVGVGLVRFRETLAVELQEPLNQDLPRARLYPENSHAGTSRLFLASGTGAFELGSRGLNRLQRIGYHVVAAPVAGFLDIAPHNLRVLSAQPPCMALLWTRELSSGDLHVCCAQLVD